MSTQGRLYRLPVAMYVSILKRAPLPNLGPGWEINTVLEGENDFWNFNNATKELVWGRGRNLKADVTDHSQKKKNQILSVGPEGWPSCSSIWGKVGGRWLHRARTICISNEKTGGEWLIPLLQQSLQDLLNTRTLPRSQKATFGLGSMPGSNQPCKICLKQSFAIQREKTES